jgi:hypothetical protein
LRVNLVSAFLDLFRPATAGVEATSTATKSLYRQLSVELLEGRETPSANGLPVALPLVGRTDLGDIGAIWEQKFDQIASARQRGNIVFVGDSVTDLYASTPFWTQLWAPVGSLNFGFGGATTAEALWLAQSGEVAAAHPRVVVLEIGTNNILEGQSGADTAIGIVTVANTLLAQMPRVKLVIPSILPLGVKADDTIRVAAEEANQLVSDWVNVGGGLGRTQFVDVGQAFVAPDGTDTPGLATLNVHPTLLGYDYYTMSLLPPVVTALTAPR